MTNSNILFLNHKKKQCGVYQYGVRLFDIVKQSNKYCFQYTEIENIHEYYKCIDHYDGEIIIYNYHGATMSWLNNSNICKRVINIGIPHETNGDLFDIICDINPNGVENEHTFNLPRPIYDNIESILRTHVCSTNEISNFINYSEPNIPTFGSFGFGFLNKGFDKIVELINTHYERAIIKLVIPLADFDDNASYHISEIERLCISKNIKSGVRLMITHLFFTNEDILYFLNTNAMNLFMYDEMHGRSISSAIDYAISARKPIGISDSYMFRNIYDDSICLYKTSIVECYDKSIPLVNKFLDEYSTSNMIRKFNYIVDIAHDQVKTKLHNNINDQTYSCYYHVFNHSDNLNGNVTMSMKRLLQGSDANVTVNNQTFGGDTMYGVVAKKLYINLNLSDTLVFEENSIVDLTELRKRLFIETTITNKNNNKTIVVSTGEAIDKYSILLLKQKYITSVEKLKEVAKEVESLFEYKPIIDKFPFLFRMLVHINEVIWLDTDKIKSMTIEKRDYRSLLDFSELSNQIFENNQKRFRVKNSFNLLTDSKIKEQKSYATSSCFILIDSQEEIYDKISEINYLLLEYDVVLFDIKFKKPISQLFINPNIVFSSDTSSVKCIILSEYFLGEDVTRDIYEFEPIKYKAGGLLGDFFNSLSVINEKFYETGRKGILYLSNDGEPFRHGLDKAYNDTYNIIHQQRYISKYLKYNDGDQYKIDLTNWREIVYYTVNNRNLSWVDVYKYHYGVKWGLHKWISNVKYDDAWSNTIVINSTQYGFPNERTINILTNILKKDYSSNRIVFVCFDKSDYEFFKKNVDMVIIDLHVVTTIDELLIILNSCKMSFLGFSAPAVFSNAMHCNQILLQHDNVVHCQLNNFYGLLPHVI